MKNKKEKTNFDLISVYNSVHSNEQQFFTVPPILESIEIFREVPSWEGLTVLEIGCGVGDLAGMIASSGAKKVIACDYSESSIAKAREAYSNLLNLKFICDDVSNLKFEEEFDVVVMQGVLEHFDKPFSSLYEIINIFLSEDGLLINSCPAFYNPRGYVWMTLALLLDVPMSLTDLHFLDIEDFRKFCNKNKLSLEWRSIHHDWASGDGLISDYKKRLVNALRDAGLPNSNVDKLLKWLKESNSYFAKTENSGAEIIYKIRKH
jgi:SAM-dependent methyltransferase